MHRTRPRTTLRLPPIQRTRTAHSGPCQTHLRPQSIPQRNAATTEMLQRSEQFLLPVYARPDFVLARGRGSWVWDTDGRKYLDFTAGIAVNALGHADEGVAKVISAQADTLLHTSNAFHHEWAGQLAELLVSLTRRDGGLGLGAGTATPGAKVFFANSGTEANEGALKVARKVGKDRWEAAQGGASPNLTLCPKTRIVCFEHGFHGRTIGALSVTTNPKYQAPFMPLLPGVDVGRLNDTDALAGLIKPETCAVIVEPIQGEGGINVACEDWLRALRARCDEVGAVLIFDEIQCGLYRTGTLWAHSSLPLDCHPDIVTMAKPLGNGYPIGAVLLRDGVAGTMTVGTHGTTFGGSPLGCAVGHHVLTRLASAANVAHVAKVGAHLRARLQRLPDMFPDVLEAQLRGRGLILGLGFMNDRVPGQVVTLARERGLFVLTAGRHALRLVPSLTVGTDEVDVAVDVLEGCLGALDLPA